jgi:hypothetical protein
MPLKIGVLKNRYAYLLTKKIIVYNQTQHKENEFSLRMCSNA